MSVDGEVRSGECQSLCLLLMVARSIMVGMEFLQLPSGP